MKPVVDGLQQNYSDRMDFYVYATADQDAEAGRFASEKGVSAVPTMVLVSPQGAELKRWVGAQSEAALTSEFEAAIASGGQ